MLWLIHCRISWSYLSPRRMIDLTLASTIAVTLLVATVLNISTHKHFIWQFIYVLVTDQIKLFYNELTNAFSKGHTLQYLFCFKKLLCCLQFFPSWFHCQPTWGVWVSQSWWGTVGSRVASRLGPRWYTSWHWHSLMKIIKTTYWPSWQLAVSCR